MKFIIVIALAALSTVAMAARPYTYGGCGLGTLVIPDKNANQLPVMTLNATGSNTFAISSGTSNCVTASERSARIKNFIEANHESLVTDMAKGQGDSVTTLAGFYGCDTEAFATTAQGNFERITSGDENATQMMVKINSMIEDNKTLNDKCTHVI